MSRSSVQRVPEGRRRDEAKQETRLALIRAGIAEFVERGLDAPSLDAICARAGYTRGAFYVHFRDREDFLVACMEWTLGGFLDLIIAADRSGTDLAETVRRFASAAVRGELPLGTRGAVRPYHLLEVCVRSEAIRERLTAIIADAAARVERAAREGQRAGTVRADVGAPPIGLLLVGLGLGLMQMIEVGMPLDVTSVAEAVLRLLSSARAAPAGRAARRRPRP